MRGTDTQLLIDEPPLQVLPSLAARIGLNEALVLQQLHYWLNKSKNVRDDRRWFYNSIEDWRVQFPFWSASTIRRTFTSLEKRGLVHSDKYNSSAWDQRKWYTINYEELRRLSRTALRMVS
jgi:hypothetical protein